MRHIVVINPNTSQATTAMMTEIVRQHVPADILVEGVTAPHGVPMILNGEELAAAEKEVVEMGTSLASKADGIIISAFGDPGLERLRALSDIPVVGICEASMLEASAGGRRFGIATVTPDLVASFAAKAEGLGLSHLFAGTRLTDGDPVTLANDAEALYAALATAVEQSLKLDRADAVIIGGGPLGRVAADLARQLTAPVIAPIRSATEQLLRHLDLGSQALADAGR